MHMQFKYAALFECFFKCLQMCRLLVPGRNGSFCSLTSEFLSLLLKLFYILNILDLEDMSTKILSHHSLLLNYWRLVIYSTDALTCVAFGDLAVLADLQLESFLHHNFLALSLNCRHNLPSPSHSSVSELNSSEIEEG